MTAPQFEQALSQAVLLAAPKAVADAIEQHLKLHPPVLRHSGILCDCFEPVADWIRQSSLQFDPAHVLCELIPWGKAQYLTLCAVYWLRQQCARRAEACCRAATRAQSNYLPAQRLLRQIQGLSVSTSSGWVCPRPFMSLDVRASSAGVCCNTWLPYSVGNPMQSTAAELWKGPGIQELRESVLNGSYHYCNPNHCPHLNAELSPRPGHQQLYRKTHSYRNPYNSLDPECPQYLQLSYDRSCNLSCPTCRSHLIAAGPEQRPGLDRVKDRVVKPLLAEGVKHLHVTYSGDPFGSPHYRDFLFELNQDDFPQLKIVLCTNGLLLTPFLWNQLGCLWPMVEKISVSIDAASSETYSRVRPPGSWDVLMENLKYLASWRRQHHAAFDLTLNFCVQQSNFTEMIDFVDLAASLGANHVYFQRLMNWGTFSHDQFVAQNICSQSHPLHAELENVLSHPYFNGSHGSPVPIRLGVMT